MLPEFTPDGNLPEGIHSATADEIFERFATFSPRRQWLGERLRSLLALTESTGQLAHVVSGFQRQAPGGDLRPLIQHVQTPTLILAAASLREEVLGDFRGASDLFPNGRLVVFPGVSGFVQHILPGPCARAWLAFASDLASSSAPLRA